MTNLGISIKTALIEPPESSAIDIPGLQHQVVIMPIGAGFRDANGKKKCRIGLYMDSVLDISMKKRRLCRRVHCDPPTRSPNLLFLKDIH